MNTRTPGVPLETATQAPPASKINGVSTRIARKAMRRPAARRLAVVCVVLALFFGAIPFSQAVTILWGPSFTPATNAPLAGRLQLTTDVDSRISVLVDDGANVWERDFYDYAPAHSVPLLGFKPGRTNLIQVTVYDKDRNVQTASQLLTFVTAPLPTNFPTYTVLKSEPDAMEPGYTFLMIRNGSTIGYIIIMDNSGEVVWYSGLPILYDLDVEPLANGDIFIPYGNKFTELNMLGETVNTWTSPTGYPINPHDGYPTDHGTILYISDKTRSVSNFPSSDTDPNAPLTTVNYDDEPVVEISATNAALLNSWSPLDVGLLDPTRITYLTYREGSGSGYGVDNEHANAVIDDTNDNSLIFSMRNQNEIVKFSRSTGQVKWILGTPDNWGANWRPYLLTPVSAPFNWNYGQHAPSLTPQGTLLVYNDNNFQASPFGPMLADQDNYSSAVEYSIDETNMEVTEVWNSAWQTNQDRLFTPYVGMVKWLPQTRNVLVTYGAVSFINGAFPSSYSTNAHMVRIMEYTHDPVPQVVSDVSFFDYTNTSSTYQGCFSYRAYQISDLYPHPAKPVADLTASVDNQLSTLEFSADPAHGYLIQASADLKDWTTIGTALQAEGAGEFYFEDLDASQFPTRFYRVVTQ